MKLSKQQYEAAVRRYDRMMASIGLEEDTVGGGTSLIHDDFVEASDPIVWLVNHAKMFYNMYLDEDTIFGEMRRSDNPNVRKAWRSEKDKLKRFIDAYEGWEYHPKEGSSYER